MRDLFTPILFHLVFQSPIIKYAQKVFTKSIIKLDIQNVFRYASNGMRENKLKRYLMIVPYFP